MRRPFCAFTTFVLIVFAATAAYAQWPSDPAENLVLADNPNEQAVPHIAATSNGGAYVGWYDHASGNYDVYLQRIDPSGYELWDHNGMPVSEHPQDSWVQDWHLITDSTDNAVLVFADIRDGNNTSIHAYRIGPDREMLWGPDGITLSASKVFTSGARVAETSDGDFVFVWTESPTRGPSQIFMQRVAPDGTLRLEEGGISITARGKGAVPGFPDIVAAEEGSVIVSWITDMTYDSSTKFLRAQKYDTGGKAVWGRAVDVFNECSLPMAYHPVMASDGAGGALFAWHYTPYLVYTSAIQHLDDRGRELFPHNGITVAVDQDLYRYYPTLSYDAVTGETYVFFRHYNGAGQYGLGGQRFSAAGDRLWGDDGKVFVPLSSTEVSSPQAMLADGGAAFFWLVAPSYDDHRVLGTRVDELGNMLWGGAPVELSSYPSRKGDLELAGDSSDGAMLVWWDYRNDAITGRDIYGQNVNGDGTLGN